MAEFGRLIAFRDHASQHFAFGICPRCAGRLDRLPDRLQAKQLEAAISNLERHPERYWFKYFENEFAAHAYVYLEAERLRGCPAKR